MTTDLGMNIRLNPNSSLVREWAIVSDTAFPASLLPEGYEGVWPRYVDRGYQYRSQVRIEVREPLSAISVVHVVFDIWNQRVRSLRFEEIADLDIGTHTFTGSWRLPSESEAVAHFSSVSYVSRVRLRNGEVLLADLAGVVEEAQRISEGFTSGDLESEQ